MACGFLIFNFNSPLTALYKFYPIVIASVLWGSVWTRKCITMLCDNVAMVDIINKGRSHCQTIMFVLRCLTWQSIIHNFIFEVIHIPGHSNIIADALSCFHL